MLLSIKIFGGIPPAERAGISPSWIQQNTTPSQGGTLFMETISNEALAAARAKLDAAESRREDVGTALWRLSAGSAAEAGNALQL